MRIYDLFLATADSSSVVNWINNGGFTAYERSAIQIRNDSLARRGFDPLNPPTQSVLDDTVMYDTEDAAAYIRSTYSAAIPTAAIGGWDIKGSGSVSVSPVIDQQTLYSFDGGNLLAITAEPGTVTLDQSIEYFLPLLGEEVTIAFSGRKIKAQTKIEVMLLVDDVPCLTIVTQSQFFGEYRRQSKAGYLPKEGRKVTLRIQLSSTDYFSFGLSGVAVILGNTPIPPFTPSLGDLVVPSGTVILFEGSSCPSGYTSIGQNRMALVSGMPARLDDISGVTEAGSATHDHNGIDGAIDCLEPASSEPHATPGVPESSLVYIKGVLENSLANVAIGAYPHSTPVAALTKEHTHSITSEMSSIPPCFPVLFCKKI